jgi:hypothetical protein
MQRAAYLIPKYKPQLVVVEYQDMQVLRCHSYYLNEFPVHHALPYFSDAPDGSFILHPPVFQNDLDTVICQITPSTPVSLKECLTMLKLGGKFMIADHCRWGVTTVRSVCGNLPKPTRKRQAIMDFALHSIDSICKQNGARLLICGINYNDQYSVDSSYCYVNAEKKMRSLLKPSESYDAKYRIHRGNPPVRINDHHNEYANGLIAHEIMEKVKECYPELMSKQTK